jgi:hypothetical protein
MFCSSCGTDQIEDSAQFCSRCGAKISVKTGQGNECSLLVPAATGKGMSRPTKTILVVAAIVVAVVAIGITSSNTTSDTQKGASPAHVASGTDEKREPASANVTLRPYELVQNPYEYRNRMVVLTMMERPVLYNGSVVQYADIGGADPRVAGQMGLMALRLNRMMSQGAALYDVLGIDATSNSQSEMLGRLLVILPDGRSQLELWRYWEVEPLGAVKGTNGFGAQIQVPEVRFWRYTDERYQTTQKLSGDSLTAVNLVKARIRPTQYLVSLQPDFNWVHSWAVNNNSICSGCWHVTYGVKVKAKSTSLYDVYENGDWDVNIKSQTVTPVDREYRNSDEEDRKPGEPLDVTTRLFQTTQ